MAKPKKVFAERDRALAVHRIGEVIDKKMIGVQAAVEIVAKEVGVGVSTLWEWRRKDGEPKVKKQMSLRTANKSGPPKLPDHQAAMRRDGLLFNNGPYVGIAVSTIQFLAANQLRDLHDGSARRESVAQFARAVGEQLELLAKSI